MILVYFFKGTVTFTAAHEKRIITFVKAGFFKLYPIIWCVKICAYE